MSTPPPSVPIPMAGMQVSPDVRLTEPLGSGSMGAVWKAHHQRLDHEVAVKFIAADLRRDETLRKRFEREAAAAALIDTPHVVAMLDQGVTSRGMPFIVMELLQGETLAELLARQGPLSPRRVAVIVAQAAKALEGAHVQGTVHRDIKPENIFLDLSGDDMLVKVLDFGVAKVAESCGLNLTQGETVLGTPYYISAEQIQSSQNVTPLADLWSLAVVAYEALTGQVPYTGESVAELFLAINDGTHQSPSSLRPELTRQVDEWFLKALHRTSEERFQSATELASSFLDVVATIPDVFDQDEDYGAWLKGGQFRIPTLPPSSRRKSEDGAGTPDPAIPGPPRVPGPLALEAPPAAMPRPAVPRPAVPRPAVPRPAVPKGATPKPGGSPASRPLPRIAPAALLKGNRPAVPVQFGPEGADARADEIDDARATLAIGRKLLPDAEPADPPVAVGAGPAVAAPVPPGQDEEEVDPLAATAHGDLGPYDGPRPEGFGPQAASPAAAPQPGGPAGPHGPTGTMGMQQILVAGPAPHDAPLGSAPPAVVQAPAPAGMQQPFAAGPAPAAPATPGAQPGWPAQPMAGGPHPLAPAAYALEAVKLPEGDRRPRWLMPTLLAIAFVLIVAATATAIVLIAR